MSSVVQQQEYSSDDPPLWFGYDCKGEPLTEQHATMPHQDSELTGKESTYSSEKEAVWPSVSSRKNKKSRTWQLHLMQVFLLAGSQQCKQAANPLLIVIPTTNVSKYIISSSNNHE